MASDLSPAEWYWSYLIPWLGISVRWEQYTERYGFLVPYLRWLISALVSKVLNTLTDSGLQVSIVWGALLTRLGVVSHSPSISSSHTTKTNAYVKAIDVLRVQVSIITSQLIGPVNRNQTSGTYTAR